MGQSANRNPQHQILLENWKSVDVSSFYVRFVFVARLQIEVVNLRLTKANPERRRHTMTNSRSGRHFKSLLLHSQTTIGSM